MAAQRERIGGLEGLAANGARLIAEGLVSDMNQRRREGEMLQQRQALISQEQEMAERQADLAEIRFNLDQLQFTQAEKIQRIAP